MNNKGFTLVELIISIVLIALLSTTVMINTSSMKLSEEENKYKGYTNKIEEAACTYVDMIDFSYSDNGVKKYRDDCKNDGCNIPVSVLIDKGLVDPDMENPKNDSTAGVDSGKVNISWVNYEGYNQKNCTYQNN